MPAYLIFLQAGILFLSGLWHQLFHKAISNIPGSANKNDTLAPSYYDALRKNALFFEEMLHFP
jgi:hypothetical protein